MHKAHDLAEQLLTLLDQYQAALARVQRLAEQKPSTLEADATYAALRLRQRVRWPDASALVDEIGMRAQDLLFASSIRGRDSDAARRAASEHDRAVDKLKAAIAALPTRESA